MQSNLLRVAVDVGEPASEAGMRVVPPHHHLVSVGGLEQLQHLGLEHRVDSLDTDTLHGDTSDITLRHTCVTTYRATLRHGKHVNYAHSVVVNKLAQHQPHDLHRHAGTPCTHENTSRHQRGTWYRALASVRDVCDRIASCKWARQTLSSARDEMWITSDVSGSGWSPPLPWPCSHQYSREHGSYCIMSL